MGCPTPVLLFILGLASAAPINGQSLVLLETRWSFGQIDGPDDQVIGEIEDVAIAEDHDVLLTDRQTARVTWIRNDGTHGGSFGQEGDGPEEFRYLGAVDVMPTGEVIVIDQGHQRLVILSRGSTGLEFERDIRLDFIPWEICLLGDRIYVTGLRDGKGIHEVDRIGEVLRSFAEPIAISARVSERWQANVDRYSVMGELICAEALDLIVMIPGSRPEVRAFSPEGRPAWTHVLTPWSRPSISETSSGRFRMAWDPETGTITSLESAWLFNPQILAIQVVENTPAREESADTELRLLNLASEEIIQRQAGLPRIAGHFSDEVVGWESLPFPRLFRQRIEIRR